MIRVTKLDGKTIMLNADLIQTIESTPDTLITLTTGDKLMVRETVDDVAAAYRRFKQDTIGIKVIQRTMNVKDDV